MNIQSVQAFNSGMDNLRAGLNDLRESKLRKKVMERQLLQDGKADEDRVFSRAMATKQLELSQNADKRARDKQIDDITSGGMDDVRKEIAALAQKRELESRANYYDAQAKATAAKPTSPIDGQLAGVEEFSNSFATALEENQTAISMLQNPQLQQDPVAFKAANSRALKAQIRLSALQQMQQNWGKSAGKEPVVKVKVPSEDGRGEMLMDVPASQWNPNHPMWKQFNPAAPGGGGTAPAMSAQDQQAMAWAQANPNDPRAAAILKKLTGK